MFIDVVVLWLHNALNPLRRRELIQQRVAILFNRPLDERFFVLGFESREIAQTAQAGQFLMIRAAGAQPYLLSRPFTIGNARYPLIEIYYEAVGRMTNALAKAHKGDRLEIFGPLGRGFTLETGAEQRWLVAGGIGVAPFPYLTLKLLKSRAAKRPPVVYLGFRNKQRVILDEFFRNLDLQVHVCTDDGSEGRPGFVTECVAEDLQRTNRRVALYGCGPQPMLRRLCEIANERGLFCEVSVEERMACGVGACLVCACKVRHDGGFAYKMVCKDGPVFNARDLVFEP